MTRAVERDLDVVVVCEINVDVVVTGLSGPPAFGAERLVDAVTLTAGSSGVLAATGMAALGLHVGVCGLVGDDPFGHYMLDHLDRHGIDRGGVVVDPAERTGAGVLLSTPHDRAILTFAGAMAHFALSRVRVDVVARAPSAPLVLLPAAGAAARRADTTGARPRAGPDYLGRHGPRPG